MTEWPDARLDDLARRVERLENKSEVLPELTTEVRQNTFELRDPHGAIARMAEQMRAIGGDPRQEKRDHAAARRVIILGSSVGGLFVLVGAIVGAVFK